MAQKLQGGERANRKCPKCQSKKVWKDGIRNKPYGKIQRYVCRHCGFRFSDPKHSRKNNISNNQQNPTCQICVPLTEDSKNLTRTKTKNVLRENHKYTAIIEQFKWHMKRKGYSKNTIRSRSYHLNNLVKLKADLDDSETVETILAISEMSNGYKKAYVVSYKSYCKWRKIFWEPPRIHVPTKIVKLPAVEDVKILIAGIGKQCGTITQLIFETGCRIGEACKITTEDIDEKNYMIHINNPEKNGNTRSIAVSQELIEKLKRLPKREDGYIFNPKTVTHHVCLYNSRKRLARKLNKPELNKIHFHLLRHLRATLELYKEGKHHRDVQYMLGHKNSQSTDRYTHYRPQAPTKWEIKRVTTVKEEDQLIIENWEFFRFDSVHQQVIYRRAKG